MARKDRNKGRKKVKKLNRPSAAVADNQDAPDVRDSEMARLESAYQIFESVPLKDREVVEARAKAEREGGKRLADELTDRLIEQDEITFKDYAVGRFSSRNFWCGYALVVLMGVLSAAVFILASDHSGWVKIALFCISIGACLMAPLLLIQTKRGSKFIWAMAKKIIKFFESSDDD